jgi:hypothetical protein
MGKIMGKSIVKQVDFVVMLSIFIIAVIYIYSWADAKFGTGAYVPKELLPAMRKYILVVSFEEILFSVVLLWKSYRFNACIFTKIASWLFLLLSLSSAFYSAFGYLISYRLLINTQLFFIVGGIIFMIICYVLYLLGVLKIKRKYRKLRNKINKKVTI